MTKIKILMTFVFVLLVLNSLIIAQSRPYEGPDDPAGDVAAERTGWMSGNRVLMFYRNTTEISDHKTWFVNKWPNTLDGTKMHDGICLLIGARVFLENDSIPVTNINEIESRTDLDTLYYCQSSYREHMDRDATGAIEWGFYPVFGYFNEVSETPAMSNLPNSWPLLGWPAFGNDLIWPNEWNGRFGRGVMKADQECYFVVNDAHDQEYLEQEDTIKYYPRRVLGANGEVISDMFIGDKKPDVTIQAGLPWGGIGIRVQARGFQWSHPAVQDAIFWEYGIANISEYDLPNMYFGLYTDNAVGGESSTGADDIAFYNLQLNMCYSWDLDGIPVGGGKAPGVYGLAFLESPGIVDGIDNDSDGLTDEKRDNDATQLVGPLDGITNLQDFKNFYSLSESDLREHWDADEDQDWNDWKDSNGNGEYDDGEDLGDDVGLDGVGPTDLNYFGPDADGTEANHKPDRLEGIAEPNFAETDISESDMVGLASFKYIFQWGRNFYGVGGDENLWKLHTTSEQPFDDAQMIPRNFVEQFASGVFELKKGLTERISMSELHSYESLEGLNSEVHKAPALFELKRLVQLIYETDYRFAQPPLMPTLVASPNDSKVYLSWDDKADKYTREAFAKNINDFEGYKIYRSTDPYLEDPTVVTDGFGSPTLKKPIYECDIIDDREGFANYGTINGIQYWLGDESGLRHSYIDNNVLNGRTYYYVLVAYDYGLKDREIGPTENTFILEIDENENVRRISQNVAIVKPHQFAAGYPNEGEAIVGERSGATRYMDFEVDLFDPNKIQNGHTYKLKLDVHVAGYAETNGRIRSPYDLKYYNDGIRVYNMTLGDSLVYHETKDDLAGSNFDTVDVHAITALTYKREIVTDLIEGLRLRMKLIPLTYPELNEENSGWLVGNSDIQIHLSKKFQYFPWFYEIIWNEPGVKDSTRMNFITSSTKVEDHEGKDIDRNKTLLDQEFNFHIINKTFVDSIGNYPKMDMVVQDINGNGVYDWDEDLIVVGDSNLDPMTKFILWGGSIFSIDFRDVDNKENLPLPNDVYRIDFLRGFHDTDSLIFTVSGLTQELDEEKLVEDMDKIKVVPNPYVVTNSMEAAVANWQRNQNRQIMFTHIPAECNISIYSMSGVLVDEIYVDNSVEGRENSWDLNSEANGTAHWDLRSSEGLEIAAGYYIYHVESKKTGDVKIGKFAIIK